jgi:hypothetical protein
MCLGGWGYWCRRWRRRRCAREAELKRIESYVLLRRSQVNSNISRLRDKIAALEKRLETT